MAPPTLDQVHALLVDVNQRIQSLPIALTEEQVKTIVNQLLEQMLADENSAFYRKMRFGSSPGPLLGSKYSRWGLGIEDIEFLYDLQTSLKGQRHVSDLGYYQGPSQELETCFKAISDAYYLPMEQVREMDRKAIDHVFPRVPRSRIQIFDRALKALERGQLLPTGRRDLDGYLQAVKAMDSAESGYGSQLVGAQYVRDLWDAAKLDTRIFALIDDFEMTDPTTYLPVEVDIPELLFVSESTANNSANYSTVKTGSQRVQVDAKKFVIHQMWSGELEEDSIIPFVPFLRRQAQMALSHYSDSLVLNGDTTNAGTGNINLDDADPADTKHYLAFDGIRHVGLVDVTANSKDLAGALTARAFLDALERMHDTTRMVHWGMPARPEDVVHALDSATYITALDLDEVITVDKLGPRATVLTGQLAQLWSHPLIVSEAVSKTEADGKVSTTAGNNTKGQIVTFNRRAFKVGWRRRVKLESERIIGTDQTRLVYSLRMGFGRFSPTGAASGIEAADVIYDIIV